MRKCSIDGLASAISEELGMYSREVTEGIKKAVDTVSKEVNQTIKDHITFVQRTGKYVKAFRVKKGVVDSAFKKVNVWHVASPHHRLSHLLENGHQKKGGGRTRAYPHIKYGEELAEARMLELTEEVVKNGR